MESTEIRAITTMNSRRVDYWSDLVKMVTANGGYGSSTLKTRSRARAIALELALPSTRDEEWRFTDLSALLDIEFFPAGAIYEPQIEANALVNAVTIPEAAQSRVVFVNGTYEAELSDLSGLPDGVTVGCTNKDLDGNSYLDSLAEKYIGQIQAVSEPFAALNTSALGEVLVIAVKPNTVIEKPIHIVYLTMGIRSLAQPRCLVVAGANSSCTIIEEYRALDSATGVVNLVLDDELSNSVEEVDAAEEIYWVNGVTEISLAENAEVHHARIQRDNGNAFHIGNTAIAQARDSRYTLTSLDLGAQVSRHNATVTQTGPGTQTNFNGLNVAMAKQTSDTHTFLNLQYPHSGADQLHKCVAGDRGHTVFNGRVFVGQQAQQTDAAQLNRNLLLSSKARVDTKPQLEIIADDVKCTHGATVSQLEDGEIFYLRSRGLDETTARRLLLDGFVGEILERLPVESLRAPLAAAIAHQIRSDA